MITSGQTSIRSAYEEICQEGLCWNKQVPEVYVKNGTNKYQKCM